MDSFAHETGLQSWLDSRSIRTYTAQRIEPTPEEAARGEVVLGTYDRDTKSIVVVSGVGRITPGPIVRGVSEGVAAVAGAPIDAVVRAYAHEIGEAVFGEIETSHPDLLKSIQKLEGMPRRQPLTTYAGRGLTNDFLAEIFAAFHVEPQSLNREERRLMQRVYREVILSRPP